MDRDEWIDVTLTGPETDLADRGRVRMFVVLVLAPAAGALSAAFLFAH